jgi:drug/metabolite transporter (DMT)-like permease
MFLSSNALYLLIRVAQKKNISTNIYSIALFIIPAIIFFILALLTKTPLIIPAEHLGLILVAGFFWSYLGNYFSQKGILYAPNPGYSLILQKSYVVLTSIAAIFLFGLDLTIPKFVGILVIVGFSAFMSLGEKTKKSESKWIVFSLFAHLAFAFGSLISKQFLNMGLEPYTYLFYINVLVAILNLIESYHKKTVFKFSLKQIGLLFGMGVASVCFNLFMQYAYKYAPNPGYVVAFNTSSIMSVALLSAVLFKDTLSKQKMIGVVGILVGLLVLAFT